MLAQRLSQCYKERSIELTNVFQQILCVYIPRESVSMQMLEKIVDRLKLRDVYKTLVDRCGQLDPLYLVRYTAKLFKCLLYNQYQIDYDSAGDIKQMNEIDCMRFKNADQLFVQQCALAVRNVVRGAQASPTQFQQLLQAHGDQMARFVVKLEGQDIAEEIMDD